ncbi:MAG: DsbA family protein [Candidatus Pacebacteria bacterium]|nr:DsbA family protein [Candidatus Paceibacterota bacterium]
MGENKKNNFFWMIVIAVIAVAVILRISILFKNEDKQVANNNQVEVESLKDTNREAVTIASSYRAQKLRGIDESDIYLGSLQAPVQIIVYEDYSDKINAGYRVNIDKLKAEFSDDVAIAFRPFYINSRGEVTDMSEALWCANDQGKFFQVREAMYTKVEQDNFSLANMEALVSDLSMDVEEFDLCVNSLNHRDRLESLVAEAKTFGVVGAPTTFINNSLIIGARQWEDVVDSNDELVEGLKTVVEKYLN